MEPINTKLFRQLIRVLERIERRSLEAPLNTRGESASEQRQSDANQAEPEQVVVPVASLPPAIDNEGEPKGDKRPLTKRWVRIKPLVEVGGFGTAIALAILTYLTLRQLGSQADAAQEQVRIMRKQLEATDRPWIQPTSANLSSDLDFYVDEDKILVMTTSLTVNAKNIGRSVATEVQMVSQPILGDLHDTPEMLERQEEALCNDKPPLLTTDAITLFPDDKGETLSWPYRVNIQTYSNYQSLGHVIFVPVVLGCITYKIPGGGDHRHHTGFAYTIWQNGAQRLLVAGKNIRQKDLGLKATTGFSDVD